MTTVRVKFIGEDTSLGKTAAEIETKAGKLDSIFQGVGQALGQSLSGGLAKGVEMLGNSIDKASDFNETISKTGVLFGQNVVPELQAWAENGAKAFGQSKQQALDAAATFAVFGKSAGLAGDDLVNFSKQNVQLASDLASFHNASPDEVITALGAAMRGESEPMRRFGVLLDDASMRQEALKLGLISTTKDALTPQQKVLAAQSLIMKQTADAQGDFARTSDGLANKQRIQTAEWENMQTAIGQKLLPIKIALTNFILEKLLPALQTLGQWVQQVASWFNEHREVLLAVAIGITAVLVPALIAWAVSAATAAAATIAATAPVIAAAAAIAALAAGVIYAYQHWDWFRNTVDAVAHFVRDVLWPVLQNIANWIINTLVPTIAGIATHVWNFATDVYNAFNSVISFLWGLPGQIANAARGMWDGIVDAFRGAINKIIELWNRFDLGIPGISLPGFLGGGSWGGIGDIVPDIPYLDTGGLIRKQTLAMVHPNEAVVPLPSGWKAGLGATYNIYLQALPGANTRKMGRELTRALREYDRSTP